GRQVLRRDHPCQRPPANVPDQTVVSGQPLHEPYPRSGVSAERRWLLFPRIAALCRDAATPGFMVPMRALPISGIRVKVVAVSTPASPPSRTFPAILARWFRQLRSVRERSARRDRAVSRCPDSHPPSG